jgi:sugar (pentulose or hexulose) kinase
MIVLEKQLSKAYPEIDLVTTPVGDLVAMVHANNCTSDINAWAGIFKEFAKAIGVDISTGDLYNTLFSAAMNGDADCGKLLSYCYYSGEPVTGFEEGRPLFARTPDSSFNLANFMRTHLYSALGALKVGLDILFDKEDVKVDKILGHGGFFKTPDVGQSVLAAAMNTDISVMETAGEGGAWGIALLASYAVNKDNCESLADFLNNKVFNTCKEYTLTPDPADVEGFRTFIERYKNSRSVEQAAIDTM